MTILIDACAILAVLLDDGSKDEIIQKTQNAFLVAPDCIDYEIGNALTSLIKRKKISVKQAVAVFGEYQKIMIRKEKADVAAAIKLAGQNNMYAYDAYYLSCAKLAKIPLLTLDEKLLFAAKAEGVVCL